MIEKEILCEGNHIRLVRAGKWEYAERKNISGIVGIVAVTKDKKLVLVEQYRIPLKKYVIELPAGLAGDIPGSETEALSEAARRELIEETGYDAERMTYLAEGPASAGICDEVIALFRAEGLKKVADGGGDDSEDIKIHEVPLDTARAWLDSQAKAGKAVDVKVYAGIYFAK